MLKSRDSTFFAGILTIMSEISVQAASAKATLLEIANQAKKLADGLQNAAPGDKGGVPNNSIQYLLAISESLADSASQCEKMVTPVSQSSLSNNSFGK